MGPSHRRTVSRPLSAEDWETRKAQISKLYGYMSLNCLMKLMEEEYFFKATKKQYKTQFSKWNLHKNTTAAEYKAMIRKKQKRERFGNARSAFRLRGAGVEDSDIIRFQKRKKICDDDEMSDVPTPSSLSCYTPTREVHSRRSSLSHNIVHSSPIPESNILVRRIIRLWTWCPATERLPVSISNWFPGFDEEVNLSAVGTPTQRYKLSRFQGQAPLHLTTRSLLLPIARFDDLHCHLDCDTIDRSTVEDRQARRNKEQQRTRAIDFQALTNDTADHLQKALFGTAAVAKTNIKLRDSNPTDFAEEPAYAMLSQGNSNSDTNDLHARTPCFPGSPASSCGRSSYQRVTTHYPESSDPTLSEAAEWHELMEG